MHEAVAALTRLRPESRRIVLESLTEADRRAFDSHWPAWAHAGQLPPDEDWLIWVLLAGRGFGKTRGGAEWISARARAEGDLQIALVGATVDEARAVMVEGPSGLLAVANADERRAMQWQPSRRRLVMASGAQAFVYSAANPESLRGPQHHIAWCDELAKWRRGPEAWDTLRLGLRLGARPQAMVTTTPKTGPLLNTILSLAGTVMTGGATRANPHLSDEFIDAIETIYAGTRYGRQELEGVLIEDVEGALWTRALIELRREPHLSPDGDGRLRRIVVGVDPPASAHGDACGIVVAGLGADGIGYVLADASIAGASPEGWARAVTAAAAHWRAHRVVAEANNGGAMVEAVLRSIEANLPLRLVHAAEGKAARAEPVASLFEAGRARFAGCFPALEDELAGLTRSGGYAGPGRSPDRADAMVWALSELMLGRTAPEPRVHVM